MAAAASSSAKAAKMGSGFALGATYGKQSVPVFKIRKQGSAGKHSVIDLVVQVMLEGNVSGSWLEGENSGIVPTETQKNTCYALALKTDYDCAEDYALALARDLLRRHKHLSSVRVNVTERIWKRYSVGGRVPHNHVFTSSPSPIRRTAAVVLPRDGPVTVTSGVRDLKVMKTTQSGFMGYIEDEYTNLKPVGAGGSSPDRIMCTELEASWTYAAGRAPEGKFAAFNERLMGVMMDRLAGDPEKGVFSKSLQETTYNMATAALNAFPEVEEVFMAAPNVHFYCYPLEQFGMKNPNVVFQSTDPHSTASGRIVTRVNRKGAAPTRSIRSAL